MTFYPDHLPVPEALRAPGFLARPLRASDAALDYAAYMESPEVIRTHSGGRWPTEGFTLEENEALAAAHERDHLARWAFTFTLLAPDERCCLGCLYIRPLLAALRRAQAPPWLSARVSERTALVTFWLHERHQHGDLADQVVLTTHAWLSESWALDGHVYRVNPDERRSVLALERAGLRPLANLWLDGEPRLQFDLYGVDIV